MKCVKKGHEGRYLCRGIVFRDLFCFVIWHISVSISAGYQQKFDLKICDEAAFVLRTYEVSITVHAAGEYHESIRKHSRIYSKESSTADTVTYSAVTYSFFRIEACSRRSSESILRGGCGTNVRTAAGGSTAPSGTGQVTAGTVFHMGW